MSSPLLIIKLAKVCRLCRRRHRRHAFVVRRILTWHSRGIDIDQAMLSLSTCVGHTMVTNTYGQHLAAVPELMHSPQSSSGLHAQNAKRCMSTRNEKSVPAL